MRLSSNFFDYYDSVRSHSEESGVFYSRIQAQINYASNAQSHLQILVDLFNKIDNASYKAGHFYIWRKRPKFLCVCGKAYLYWAKEWGQDQKYIDSESLIEHYKNKLDHGKFKEVEDKHYYEACLELSGLWDENKITQIGDSIFQKLDCPVFLFESNITLRSRGVKGPDFTVILNSTLKDFGFEKILDPYTCFQEISMYLGNQLARPDIAPIRVGSDKIIAAQKGFDEMSFRTNAPGNKKAARQANKARKQR